MFTRGNHKLLFPVPVSPLFCHFKCIYRHILLFATFSFALFCNIHFVKVCVASRLERDGGRTVCRRCCSGGRPAVTGLVGPTATSQSPPCGYSPLTAYVPSLIFTSSSLSFPVNQNRDFLINSPVTTFCISKALTTHGVTSTHITSIINHASVSPQSPYSVG